MKILALAIFKSSPSSSSAGAKDDSKVQVSSYELSEFSYFKRGGIQEFLTFFMKTLADRTAAGVRQSVEEEGNIGHCFKSKSSSSSDTNIALVLVCDKEYPTRVAFTLLNKVLEEYNNSASKSAADLQAMVDGYLMRFQNPREADSIMRVQAELDETKIVLHKTIESVLDRGEKLDNLVAQSEALSTQSKAFYKTAKKTNSSCCSLQ